MFHYKKSRFKLFLYPFLASLLAHSPVLLLLWNSPSTDKIPDESNIVLVDYPDHQQIVIQKTFNKIRSTKHTPYLSMENNTVEKETKAMLKGLFYQAEPENPSTVKKQTPTKNQKIPVTRKISSLSPILLDKIAQPIQMDITEMKNNDFLQPQNTPDLSRNPGFLPGVDPGSHTLLNTKEFMYYSYYSRMHRQLHWRWTQHLRAELSLLLFKLNNQRNKQRLFSTDLYVHLSSQGEIQDIMVVKSSGTEEVDSAAMQAFLLAEPFPNPPKGLVEEDGHIHIKQSFHLYVSPSVFANLFSKQN